MVNLTVTAWTGMTIRNIFHGSILDELTKHFNVTLLSYYGEQLKQNSAEVSERLTYDRVRIPRWQLPKLQGRLISLLLEWDFHAMWLKHSPRTMAKRIHLQKESHPFSFVLNQLGGRFVNYLRNNREYDWLRDTAYFLPSSIVGQQEILMVTTTDLAKDRMLLYSCKKLGLPVVALVHSWDNLPGRGLLPVIPDRLLVWNDFMVEEGVMLHDVPRDRIDVIGGAQYELYRKLSPTLNIEQFRRRLDIPEDARILTFTAEAIEGTPDEPYFVDALIDLVSNRSFGNAVLVLRVHPSDRRLFYREKFSDSKLPIRLDIPDDGFAAENRSSIGQLESIKQFVELMKFSDVIITGGSTIALDAMLFDTPVITVKFNLTIDKTSWNSAHVGHTTNHFSRISNSGAIYRPENMEDFKHNVLTCLSCPEEKRLERQKIVNQTIPDLPTAHLVVKAIQKTLDSSNN